MSDVVIEPRWMRIARAELGIRELPGAEHESRILEYHEATLLRATADEVPWCSAFACWVFERCGIPTTRSAAARSWLGWGVGLPGPRIGAVVVLRRGAGWQGHVGFVVGVKGDRVAVLGGNQGNAVSVRSFRLSLVLGYRWPESVGL